MKKRILALALAGTTAFSVFGSAISANAATSTDVEYQVDAYVSYKPVATTINVEYTGAKDAIPTIAYINTETETVYKDGNDYLTVAEIKDKLSRYPEISGNYTVYTYVPVDNSGSAFYIDLSATDAQLWEDNTVKVLDGNGSYTVNKLSDYVTRTENQNKNGYVYTLNSDETKTSTSLNTLLTNLAGEDANVWHVICQEDRTNPIEYIFEKEYQGGKTFDEYTAKYKTVDDYFNANVKPIEVDAGTATDAEGTVSVDGYKGNTLNEISDYALWDFNADLTGEVAVEPYEVSTSFVNGKLKVTKTVDPTIYAYDFLYTNSTGSSAVTISNAWNAHNETATANAIVTTADDENHLVAETGRGRVNVGIRYDVVTEWEDFLEELALNDDFGYSESFSEFRDNYLDMFYSDPVFDRWTGELVGYKDVDLYNIEGLLWDIWQLHERADYEAANTSELIYLMQQYDKYIGEYINQAEVASDDWGDLLLSVLDAATEDDFRNATEYRKYQNEVEDLRDAYELATTANMIREAEVKMYQLLVSANTRFRASANPDKAALNSSLEGLFFNVGDVPTEYSVLPSTTGTTNVDYTNYNYYVSALNITSAVSGQNLAFTGTLTRGYYSLYPMDDYYEAGNKNYVYPGNVAATTGENVVKGDNYYVNGTSTDEYEWFWNVYQLAANMNASNTKQGSVDAVNDALNAAVAELTATITPNSTEVAAVEDALDKYAGKIDTDYNEGYYAKYTQANEYAEVAEGKWQTRIAAMINGVAGEALTYQGTQVTVTKNDMKTVETAIKNGKTALEAIKESDDYNAAQVTALNKAIDQAQYLVDLYEGTYSTSKTYQSVNKNYSRLVGDKDQMVKSDLTKAIEAIDAAINYSEIVMGWSKNDAGKWQYGTEEGYLNDGWHQVDGGKTWFYFNADGTAKQSEWWNDNGTWYWFNSNCGAATGWAKVDGEWYFFKGNNAMKTGWEKVDGNWYYMASSGKMVTGWCEIGGKWYYFSKESNSLGQMLYSTTVDGYKLGADGAWIK